MGLEITISLINDVDICHVHVHLKELDRILPGNPDVILMM